MKPLMLVFFCVLFLHNTQAQTPALEISKQEMQKLAYMSGRWQGEATVRQGNTPPIKVLQEEDIQFKLDGTIMLIEGIGRKPEAPEAIVFNAMAVVSYNQYTKQYGLKTYTKEGNQADAYFKIVSDNHFEWGFETPTKAKIRYDIVLNPQDKTWIEKGEYSPDGNAWYPFIEIKLLKVE
jgi:hypothetical protein